MSLAACAEIVRKGDPDRFLSVMAAPPAARAALFPIYAFNVEVARAPWVTQEAMIAEMRLQWWRDALDEIATGKPVRRHEVTTPLAAVLDADGAGVLDKLVQARRWDIYRDPFEDGDHFAEYLSATSGGLMWVAARALGADAGEAPVREVGYASGLANWFKAIPQLEAQGRVPLVDGRTETVVDLAQDALSRLKAARRQVPKPARPATRSGWQAGGTLRAAVTNPAVVPNGGLHIPEFRK
ncbi:MAG: squalene/phytoene synthase family protein, partial [Marinosulfonomonas sp.]|nr:squalene/phytoene synthase family protein [Marinosulfonomonas sp.]